MEMETAPVPITRSAPGKRKFQIGIGEFDRVLAEGSFSDPWSGRRRFRASANRPPPPGDALCIERKKGPLRLRRNLSADKDAGRTIGLPPTSSLWSLDIPREDSPGHPETFSVDGRNRFHFKRYSLSSRPAGLIGQVREASSRLLYLAKHLSIPSFSSVMSTRRASSRGRRFSNTWWIQSFTSREKQTILPHPAGGQEPVRLYQ